MKAILIHILVAAAGQIIAQAQLPSGQIEVIKDFEVRLTETSKVVLRPEAIPFDTSVRRFTYAMTAPSPAIDYAAPGIRTLLIEPEKRPVSYPFMAKAGVGNPNAWLGHIAFDRKQSDDFGWGVDARFSAADNQKIPLQKYSELIVQTRAQAMLSERLRLHGHVHGTKQTVHFYGAENIPDNPESLRRRYHRFDALLGVEEQIDAGNPLGYRAGLQVLLDRDNNGVKESNLIVSGGLKALLQGEIPVGFDCMADLTSLATPAEKKLNNFFLKPHLKEEFGELRLQAGATFLFSPGANAVLPDLEVAYPISGPRFVARIGWSGEVWKNNFHALTAYNPFLQDRIDTLVNTLQRRIYIGGDGQLGKFTYDLTCGYTRFQRMAFFLQDPQAYEEFEPVFDDGRMFDFEGVFGYSIDGGLAMHVRFFRRFYTLEDEDRPWHRPSFGGDVLMTYSGLGDNFHASFTLHTENGLPYRTPGGTQGRLAPLLDLNVQGDYYFTASLGGFLQLNNLTNNKRERWVNYPSFGFNMKAGLVLRLP